MWIRARRRVTETTHMLAVTTRRDHPRPSRIARNPATALPNRAPAIPLRPPWRRLTDRCDASGGDTGARLSRSLDGVAREGLGAARIPHVT